jgi:phytol kinase
MSLAERYSEIEAILIMGVAFVGVLVLGQVLHRGIGIWAGHTRKFIHIAVGVVCLSFRYPFQNIWIVLGSSAIFITLILLTRKKDILTALNRKENKSSGDWLLSVAIIFNFLLLRYYEYDQLFYLPFLVLTFSDPAAFYGGYFFKKTSKSIPGVLAFVVTALVSIVWFLSWNTDLPATEIWTLALVCGLTGAFFEYHTHKGWDNLSVPVVVGLVLVIYEAFLKNAI